MAWLSLMGGLLGIFLGLCYDFFALGQTTAADIALKSRALPLLSVQKPGKQHHHLHPIIMFCKDFMFCLFSGICVILLFYEYNHGKIRFPALLTMLLGGVLYTLTLRRVVRPLVQYCRFWLRTLIRYLLFFAIWPLRKLFSIITACIKAILKKQKAYRWRIARNRETAIAFSRIQTDGGGLLPSQKKKGNRKGM